MKIKSVTGARMDPAETKMEKEHRALALRAALEGIVLLENRQALPLTEKKLALFGPGALYTIKGGTGSGEVNERYSVNIHDGLVNEGFEITNEDWLNDYKQAYRQVMDEHDALCRKAAKGNLMKLMEVTSKPVVYPAGRIADRQDAAPGCTTALYVLSRQAGESGDRRPTEGDYLLTQAERDQLTALRALFQKLILVINTGSAIDTTFFDTCVPDAVIFFGQQGEEGGNALAMLLSGRATPSGKLSDTWFTRYEDVPFAGQFSSLDGDPERNVYQEGIYVGYRYTDAFGVAPRYPFGYGLSYTSFACTPGPCEREGDRISLSVLVKNTGKLAGKEVIQLYATLPGGRLKKERKRLVAYKKTGTLQPGEEELLRLSFPLEYLKSYDEEKDHSLMEKGCYGLYAGDSAASLQPCALLKAEKDILFSVHKSLCAPKEDIPLFIPATQVPEQLSGVPVIQLDPGAVTEVRYDYAPRPTWHDEKTDALLRQLSDRDKIEICVGTGFGGMFSAKGSVAPGTVGRTTDRFIPLGLINSNLSDGPAGLRLLQQSAIRGKRVRMKSMLMGFMAYMPKSYLRLVSANEKKDTILYQYATAFPVGTCLTQTWNEALLEEVGAAIGREMEAYRITWWLAPAMNIHRNPLCGRNFEYFSEDPVLTGKTGAALTRGVQSIPGRYVTIKHFCCNNQEDHRNLSDSIVSRRALREIYLRGFEICTREADPRAVMTSYNRLNGVYTPNRKDLLEDILRAEWGFDGIVMTDWGSTGKALADTAAALEAGNDMIMPGSKYDKKRLQKALKDGSLSPAALERAAAGIVRLILSSNITLD